MQPTDPPDAREDEAARYRTLLEINNALIATLPWARSTGRAG